MNFLYFLPVSRDGLKPPAVVAHGLHDVLRDRMTETDLSGLGRVAVASVTNGPGGQMGTLLQCLSDTTDDETEPVAVGYFPNQQTWQQTGKYWTGYVTGQLPTATELRRDKFISGVDVTLENGDVYECPTIRLMHDGSNLPDVWKLVDGKFKSITKPDWNWAWELSGDIWDSFVANGSVNNEQAFEWCVKLVGINYRVGPHEASILELFGSSTMASVLQSAIGGKLLEHYADQQKKSEPAPTETTASSYVGAGSY